MIIFQRRRGKTYVFRVKSESCPSPLLVLHDEFLLSGWETCHSLFMETNQSKKKTALIYVLLILERLF